MGEQRNLTEENVEELKKHLERMQETNPDLEYSFSKQKEHKEPCGHEDRTWFRQGQPCPKCGE